MPSAGPATAPFLLLREKKAVGPYSGDQQYEAKVRNHHIDLNAAFGRVQHGKRTKLAKWGSVTGRLQKKARLGRLTLGWRRISLGVLSHKRPRAWRVSQRLHSTWQLGLHRQFASIEQGR